MATATEQELITQTVLDYFEGWFNGDADRMDRALHDDLAKRWAGHDGTTTKARMVELTAMGEGRKDAEDQLINIEIEDVCEDIASVTVRTAVYYEYLHLARSDGAWKILNALWRLQ